MNQKITLLLIILVAMLSCSRQDADVVVWKPRQPEAGDRITLVFKQPRFVKTEQQDFSVFMVYQLVQDNEIRTFRIPMAAKKQSWQASVKIEPGAALLRVKFEDSLDRVDDNNGYGWNIILRDDKGNVVRNAHYELGVIFGREKASGFIPEQAAAHREFKQEISSFPDNYDAWFALWDLTLKTSNWQKDQTERVQAQVDSLLSNSDQNADLLALAFNTYWKLLKKPETAIEYGNKILANYQNDPLKEEIEYALIFLKYEKNPEAVMNELIQFTQQAKNPQYLKSAIYQLGTSFQNFRMVDEAIHFFQKYLELAPTDVAVCLNLANLYLRKQSYDLARQMIEQAQAANTDDNYFQSNPWEEPQQRKAQVNLTQCQILSTQATLEAALENYPLAIQHRKQVIEQGTPFPAFEWVKIGDLFFQLGNFDSAKQAYVKAVAINFAEEEAIQKLGFIYQLTTKQTAGFDRFLKDEVDKELKVSAKSAPDIALTDLNGDLFQLSDQRSKLVILTFWDSWSNACQLEIPQLNKLVEEFKDNQNIVFWAISVEAPISINKFISQNPFHFHLFHSGFEAKQLFKVIGFPTHFVIDPSGKIRYTRVGYSENIQEQLKNEILSILEEEQPIS